MALADQVYGFFIPSVTLLGLGASKEAGEQAKALGATKLLIVTDAGLAKIGVADTIKGYVTAAGLEAV
ncbi:MAG: L-threonine dehydrogenase, partial [Desulfuromonadales bacterium]|nr:L-threonine dehydrogenase [Desulfuromonadales bacterium]